MSPMPSHEETRLHSFFKSIFSILEGSSQRLPSEGYDPLFAACSLVFDAEGLRIAFPSHLENEKLPREERLQAICTASQTQRRRVTLQGEWWLRQGPSMLGFFVQDELPIALICRRGHYEKIDPSNGIKEKVDDLLAAKLSSKAYLFYGVLPEADLKNILSLGYRGSGFALTYALLLSLLGGVIGLVSPFFTKVLFDQVIPYQDYSTLYQVLLALFSAAIAIFFFYLSRSFFLIQMEGMIQNNLTAALWDRMLKLPLNFFRSYAVGDLIQRVSIVEELRRALGGNILKSAFTILFSLLYLIPMFYYSWQLTLIVLAFHAIILFLSLAYFFYRSYVERYLLEIKARINQFLIQMVRGIAAVRAAGAEKRAFSHWGESFFQLQAGEFTANRFQSFVAAFSTMLSTLSLLAVFWAVFNILEENKDFTVGSFMAFNTALAVFSQATTSLLEVVMALVTIIPQLQRAKIIFETPVERRAEKLPPGLLRGHLRLEKIYFKYSTKGQFALEDIGFEVYPGEFLAIVGESGSGKSTLLRLLMGFEIPLKGGIYYDNKELATLDLEEVRKQIGAVMQASTIFAGTIYENIVCGRCHTPEQLQKAIHLSSLAETFSELPLGLKTLLLNGGNTLSGGQKQRILLARSLLLEPKILLFDEATSYLDNATQAAISANIEALHVTRIVIAHRLSTIKNADRILVLDRGRIIESGSYKALCALQGTFASFVAEQTL